MSLTHGSLFSGIGGFDLAAEWAGWENKFHCEWNEFGRKVLKYYWPETKSYENIIDTDFTIWRERIDVITGGFPCQPYSVAGKRLGKEDDRHLWPEMLRAIREVRPKYVVGENVPGIINWKGGMVFDEVCIDLENEGYTVQPVVLPACGVNGLHRRYRVWVIAYSSSMGRKDVQDDLGTRTEKAEYSERIWKSKKQWHKEANELDSRGNYYLQFQEVYGEPPIFSEDDGIPFEVDGITVPKFIEESLKAAGNAIVPQVAYQIFKVINQMENISA